LNMDGIGAKTIKNELGGDLIAGDLPANSYPMMIFDGTNWVLIRAVVGWQTGDVKSTIKTTADTGWVMMDDGTIGDASSGGTTRANADTSALFALLWNNTADADCPVSTGRGASAAADFAAHKTITLPQIRGRVVGGQGAGTGLTSRALASKIGHEDFKAHNHVLGGSGFIAIQAIGGGGLNNFSFTGADTAQAVVMANTGTGTQPAGQGAMQPTVFLNYMIKL